MNNNIAKYSLYFYLIVMFFLLCYVPTENLEGYSTNTILINYTFLITLIYILMLFILLIFKKNKRFIKIDWSIFFLFIIILSMVLCSSLFYPVGIKSALGILAWHILVMLCLYILIMVFDIDYYILINIIFKSIIGFALISFIIAVLAWVFGSISFGPVTTEHYYANMRLYGWFGNPNRFGVVLGTAILCTLIIILKEARRKKKNLLYICLLFLLMGLIWTGSKSAIVSTLIGALSIPLIRRIKLNKMILMLAILIMILFLKPQLVDYILSLLRIDSFDNHRFEIWSYFITLWSDTNFINYVLGHGSNYFSWESGRSPHNGYIRWLVDFGLVFFVFFIGFISYLYGKIKQTKRFSIELALLMFLLIGELFTQALLFVRFESFIFIIILVLISMKKKTIYE